MDAKEIETIKQELGQITQGVWLTETIGDRELTGHRIYVEDDDDDIAYLDGVDESAQNANFIAHAPAYIARLITEVERLNGVLAVFHMSKEEQNIGYAQLDAAFRNHLAGFWPATWKEKYDQALADTKEQERKP